MSRYHANELLNNRKNSIQHWKYIKKIPVGKGYRYFYSMDEYRAFLNDSVEDIKEKSSKRIKKITKKASTKMSDVRKKLKSFDKNTKKKINALLKKTNKKLDKTERIIKNKISKGEKYITKRTKKTKEIIVKKDPHGYKYVEKIKVNGKAYYFYSKQEYLNYLNRKNKYFKNEPDFMKDFKHSDTPYTRYEDAIMVNPKYGTNPDPFAYDDYEYNCAECSAIYELRRRGYDVESNGVGGVPNSDGLIKQMTEYIETSMFNTDDRLFYYYKNPKIQYVKPTEYDFDTAKAIYSEITKNPPGSRGEISVSWKGGGGHSMVWEYDENKKVHIIDTQVSGQSTIVEYDLKELSKRIDNKSTTKDGIFINDNSENKNKIKPNQTCTRIVRTDNLELNDGIKYIIKDSDKHNGYGGYEYDPYASDYHDVYKKSSNKTKQTKYPTLSKLERRSEFIEWEEQQKEVEEYKRKHGEYGLN